MTRRRSLPAALALTAAAALALAACGNSTGTGTTSGGSSSAAVAPSGAAAGGDTVTAIPALKGVGTTVILDKATVGALTGLGVALAPEGKATFEASKGEITFPITGGYAELHSDKSVKPGYVQGSIQHQGSGFSLTAAGTVVRLTDFVVDPGYSKLYGSVAVGTGKPMLNVPLLDLDGSKLEVSMPGGKLQLFGTAASLTNTAATALAGVFKTTKVIPGLALGVVRLVADPTGVNTFPASDAAATIPRLQGKGTSVILNSDTAAALTSLGVMVAPSGNAKSDMVMGKPAVTFPITNGFVIIHKDHGYLPGYIDGVVDHAGSGLTFSKGGKSLTISEFVVDPGSSILTGTVGGKPGVPLLDLDGSKVELQMEGSNPVLYGTVAKLTTTAASALNKTFGTDKVMAGTPLGIVRIVAQPATS